MLLAHPNVAIAVAELTRNFVIEKAQLVKNNNGRVSKQMKLYDYITGSAQFRKMWEKIEKRLNLDELQRKEEAYVKRTWNDSKKLIQDWYDLDREDQDNLNAITQEEDQIKEKEKEDVSRKDG